MHYVRLSDVKIANYRWSYFYLQVSVLTKEIVALNIAALLIQLPLESDPMLDVAVGFQGLRDGAFLFCQSMTIPCGCDVDATLHKTGSSLSK